MDWAPGVWTAQALESAFTTGLPGSLSFRLEACLPASRLPDSDLPGMPCLGASALLWEPLSCLGCDSPCVTGLVGVS